MDTKLQIIRSSPSERRVIRYPERYPQSVFDKYIKFMENKELQSDYIKWKNGINYNTNRKIKIGGKIHVDVGRKFWISYTHKYYNNDSSSCRTSVFFLDLKNIDVCQYLQETERIKTEIDLTNAIIHKYNKLIYEVTAKINNLQRWDEYIQFEGNNYGLSTKVMNNIHRENNCNGNMQIFNSIQSQCNKCENGMWSCGRDCWRMIDIYKCNKCGFVN